MDTIGINFPIKETQEGGLIGTTKTESQTIKADLTAFLMLKRRQRVMNNAMYSPVYDYVMEQWDEISQNNLTVDLKSKLTQFMPEITVQGIGYTSDPANPNMVNISITYTIVSLSMTDQVTFNIPTQNQDALGNTNTQNQ